MKLGLSALMLAACGLAGCQTLYQDDNAVPEPAKDQQVSAPLPAVAPIPAPPPPKPRPPRKAAPPSATAPTTTPPETTPIVLVGLSRPELARTLGEPTERAEQNPGQTWVYRASGCSVEVLFLFDVVRNEMFAIDHKIVGTDGSARAEQQCLQRIKAGHAS